MPTNLAHSSQKFNPFHRPLGEAVLDALRPFNLKGGRGGQYRCNSPLRPGANSHSFCFKIEAAGESGCWRDAVSGESGSLRELADRLGILDSGYSHVPFAPPAPTKPKPERPPKPEPPAPTGDDPQSLAVAYAAEKGVPWSAFERAGWVPMMREGRPALAIPTANGTRFRFLDGAKPKFKSPTGYKQCLYGFRFAPKLHEENGHPFILCNGEPSAVVAQHHGIPAFSIAGKGEGSRIPDHILNKLKANCEAIGGKIIITYDADDAGHIGAHKVAGQLREIGFEVTCLDFGDGKFTGYDLADFCREHPEDAAERLYTLPELPAPDTEATVRFTTSKPNPKAQGAQIAQFLSVLCAELGMTNHNRVCLFALWGASGGRTEFHLSNAILGTHLRKRNGEIFPAEPGEIDPDALERHGKMSRVAGQAWKRFEAWQESTGIMLIERDAGFMDAATGERTSSRYRLPILEMAHAAIEAARQYPAFGKSPGKMIEGAARELAGQLLESARPPARTDEPAESALLAESADDARAKSLRRLEKLKAEISEGLRSGALRPEDVSAALGEITEMIFSQLPDEPPEEFENGTLSIQGGILSEYREGVPPDESTGWGTESCTPPSPQVAENEGIVDVDFVEFADLPEFPRTDAPDFPASAPSSGSPLEPAWVADRFACRTPDGTPADVLRFKLKDDSLVIEAQRLDAGGLLDLLPARLECDDGGEWMKPAENVRRWLAMLESDDRRKRDEASAGLAELIPDVGAFLRGAGAACGHG